MLIDCFDLDDDRIVLCPCCGGTYLHHDKVEVYQRATEDASEGLAVHLDGDILVRTSMETNPSRRRDGMRVRFWCEGCDETPSLILVQHKGQTFWGWEKGGAA